MTAFPWLKNKEIVELFRVYRQAGHELRFVGGCVRDTLLGLALGDFDAATDAVPEESIQILGKARIKVVPTGLDHGTVTAVFPQKSYEITSLRADIKTDGRHAVVRHTKDWKEDASRRDFTINALYVDEKGKVYDYFGGREDLNAKAVRFIGDAETRIGEDYLRILRFFRFYARFGGAAPDAEGLAACEKLAANLAKLSRERIRDEFLKILLSPRALDVLGLMQNAGILPHVYEKPADLKALEAVKEAEKTLGVEPDPVRRLSALWAASSRTLQSRFALANKQAVRVDSVQADLLADWPQKPDHEILYRLSPQRLADWLVFAVAKKEVDVGRAQTLLKTSAAWQSPKFPVSGEDLQALGYAGPTLGQKLRELEAMWIGKEFRITKADLLACLAP